LSLIRLGDVIDDETFGGDGVFVSPAPNEVSANVPAYFRHRIPGDKANKGELVLTFSNFFPSSVLLLEQKLAQRHSA
jgi:hypothetical protein